VPFRELGVPIRKKAIRVRIKRLRTAAFILVVSGLLLVSLYTSHREPPLVRIGEIKPVMNFSTVRVQGVLESDARQLQSGSVLYMIADETGSLPVFINPVPAGDLPAAGSRVAATGHLSVGAGNQARMRVHDAGQIKVLGKLPPTIVCGQVSKVWSPPPDSRAPYRITLARPEGSLEVVHWFTPEHQVAVGDRLEAKGNLGSYKGRLQLKVRKAGDIRLQPEG